MKTVQPFMLHWIAVFSFYTYGTHGFSLCTKISMELGVPEFETLCDLDFCTCRDPFGRVRCVCPAEDPSEEIILKSKDSCSVPADATSLSLENCKKVTVIKEALQDVRSLTKVEFINVSDVSIAGRIFHPDGPSQSVHFINSTIPDIPSFTFSGNMDSVIFEGSTIGIIRAFAFSNIKGADRIMFLKTNVMNVEAQTFKKFTTNKFLLVDSSFKVIPSRFVVDVGVEQIFKIDSTNIDAIRTLGFQVYGPKKVLILNSKITRLQEEAFKIVTKGEVVVENNVIRNIDNEAFRGISVDRYVILQSGKQKFKFRNQTVTNAYDKSLYINRSAFDVQIGKIQVDEACTCDGLTLWKNILNGGKKNLENTDVDLELILCQMGNSNGQDYMSGHEFYNDQCTKLTASIYFFVLIITATAVGILIVIVAIVCIVRKRRQKWKYIPSAVHERGQKEDKNRSENKKGKKKQPPQRKSDPTKAIIVPDGRTYKETEFHIIVEKAEPLNDDCVPGAVVRDRSQSQINPSNRT
ncbi:hypothetical protein RUM43_002808 [Polyplax serrata]|uniref:Uncharacterized protein n=1 Tax=Polyplax serrata TaxID=468196 RepID=A0AAN8PGK3_POLSC